RRSHADVDLDRAPVTGRDAYRDPPTSGAVARLPGVDRRQHIGRLLHAVHRRVLETQAVTARSDRFAASLRGAFALAHLEEIAEVRVDGDVGFKRDVVGTGVLDRPLILDRVVDADAPLDLQATERVAKQCA